jgi:hypothetical protein
MSILKHYEHERVTALELALLSRHARRQVDKAVGYELVNRRVGPAAPSGLTSERIDGRVLYGLEVYWTSGSQVHITQGALFGAVPSPVTETRPGTWSGILESDDAVAGLAELLSVAVVAPTSPIGSALSQPEWWIVYVTVAETNVETDSQMRVYDGTTGAYVASTAVKIKQRQLVPGVVRGGGAAPVPVGSLPAGAIQLAWLYVPSGSTSLSQAVIYDVRKLPDQVPGPNEIGGAWSYDVEGEMQSPYQDCLFFGHAWARLGGELLSVRAALNGSGTGPSAGIQVADIAEPGATWDGAASLSAPKFAWLYLGKPEGVVPRPVRHGNGPIGNGSFTSDAVAIDGVLILSPTPPRIRTDSAEHGSGHRWDMRASADLSPASFTRGTIPHAFASTSVDKDDAICVGFYRYTDVVGGLPVLFGALSVDEHGWMTGNAINTDLVGGVGVAGGGGLAPAGLVSLGTPSVTTAGSIRTLSVTITLQEVSVGGNPYALPVDAIRMRLDGFLSNSGQPIRWLGPDNGILTYPDATSPYIYQQTLDRRANSAGNRFFTFRGALDGVDFTSRNRSVVGVRMPYGETLIT